MNDSHKQKVPDAEEHTFTYQMCKTWKSYLISQVCLLQKSWELAAEGSHDRISWCGQCDLIQEMAAQMHSVLLVELRESLSAVTSADIWGLFSLSAPVCFSWFTEETQTYIPCLDHALSLSKVQPFNLVSMCPELRVAWKILELQPRNVQQNDIFQHHQFSLWISVWALVCFSVWVYICGYVCGDERLKSDDASQGPSVLFF